VHTLVCFNGTPAYTQTRGRFDAAHPRNFGEPAKHRRSASKKKKGQKSDGLKRVWKNGNEEEEESEEGCGDVKHEEDKNDENKSSDVYDDGV
jgi:hypothetical protein